METVLPFHRVYYLFHLSYHFLFLATSMNKLWRMPWKTFYNDFKLLCRFTQSIPKNSTQFQLLCPFLFSSSENTYLLRSSRLHISHFLCKSISDPSSPHSLPPCPAFPGSWPVLTVSSQSSDICPRVFSIRYGLLFFCSSFALECDIPVVYECLNNLCSSV